MKLVRLCILCLACAFFASNGVVDAAASSGYSIVEEVYSEKSISIHYPHIAGLEDEKIQSIVNTAIATDALRILQEYSAQEQQDLSLNLTYEIKWQSRELLSIVFSGQRYLKGTPYPVKLFFTTNLLLRDGSRSRLKDVVTVDEQFVHTVRSGKLAAVSPELTLDTLRLSTDRLLRAFSSADLPPEQNSGSVYTYFTDTGLGLSVGVIHAMGDYVVLKVNYSDIAANMLASCKGWIPAPSQALP